MDISGSSAKILNWIGPFATGTIVIAAPMILAWIIAGALLKPSWTNAKKLHQLLSISCAGVFVSLASLRLYPNDSGPGEFSGAANMLFSLFWWCFGPPCVGAFIAVIVALRRSGNFTADTGIKLATMLAALAGLAYWIFRLSPSH